RPGALAAELRDARRGPALLTVVAATCVLGSQVSLLTANREVAAGLWAVGCVLWLVLVYALFAAMTTRPEKPAFAEGMDGGWLLIVVATQALVVLGTGATGAPPQPAVLFAMLCLFLLGGLFYLM